MQILVLYLKLKYPKELRESHNDYPLAPEKIKVDNVENLWEVFIQNTITFYLLKILNNILNRD